MERRRRWMYEITRHSEEFDNGLTEFMKVAEENRKKNCREKICCPCKSCQILNWFCDAIQERKNCYLLVPHVVTREVICAQGVLWTGSDMLHGSRMLDGYAKVQLDTVDKDYTSLDLPVPSDEHFKLADAIGSFIQWPKSRIKPCGQPSSTPDQRDVRSSSSKNSTSRIPATRTCGDASPSSAPSPTYDLENHDLELHSYSTRIMRRPEFIQAYYLSLMSRSNPGLTMSREIRVETFSSLSPVSIDVTPMEVMTLLTRQELEMTILALFVSALHNSIDTDLERNGCAFLNPFSVNGSMCQWQPMTNRLTLSYISRGHWSLFILRPNELTGYILDSIGKGKTEDHYRLPSFVKKLFKGFRWIFPKVQQQQSNWECGYYVMNWLYDFVKYQQYSFPAYIPWNDTRSYELSQLDDMVKFWTKAIPVPKD
uniref:uncharacterized protein LOC122610198 n=1 Tax=Erigeron canadensis TaxID=72917 RepID=UPI001CB8CCA1|nr:uncharacterized protein LOC122610198 [Erigeron canadensis]